MYFLNIYISIYFLLCWVFIVVLCCAELPSRVRLLVTPCTVAHQAPLSMGILQARILEWVAMPSSRGSSQPGDWTQVSCISGGFFTVWATRGAQEHRSGQPIPSPGDLPDPGIELGSPDCRWILYQLSFQGGPIFVATEVFSPAVSSRGHSSCSTQVPRHSGFSCCGAWALGHEGFSSCGSQTLEHRPSSCSSRA